MPTLSRVDWKDFWDAQKSPLNNDDTDAYYERYGAELRLLLGGGGHRRVLELGCGDGALVSPLGFDRAERYLGLDPSGAMLEVFSERHPDLETSIGDHSFETDESFDLIFSCAVVQFMDLDMASEHLAKATRMLAPGGRIVWASVPWRRLRWAYARRDLAGFDRRPLPLAVAAHLQRRILRDNMGFWHDTPEFDELAAQHGLTYRFYGSLNYSYRFHSVFERT